MFGLSNKWPVRYQITIRQIVITLISVSIAQVFIQWNIQLLKTSITQEFSYSKQQSIENQLNLTTKQIYRSLKAYLQHGQLPIQTNQFCLNDWFCYAAFSQGFSQQTALSKEDESFIYNLSQKISNGNNFNTSLMSSIYFSYYSESQILGWYPNLQGLIGYYPHSRPWYKQTAESFENKSQFLFQMTEPYVNYGTDEIGLVVTISRPLIDLNQQFRGVIAADLNFLNFKNTLTQQFYLQSMVIHESGYVLLNLFIERPIDSINYIWNQEQIGFSQNDWIQIKHSAQSKPYINNCTTIKSTQLCLYNTQKKEEVIINSILYEEFGLYIIQFMGQEKIQKQISQYVDNIAYQIEDYRNKYLLYSIIYMSVLIILAFFILKIIIKPVEQLQQFTLNKIYKKNKGSQNLVNIDLDKIFITSTLMRELINGYIRLLGLFKNQSLIKNEPSNHRKSNYRKIKPIIVPLQLDGIRNYRQNKVYQKIELDEDQIYGNEFSDNQFLMNETNQQKIQQEQNNIIQTKLQLMNQLFKASIDKNSLIKFQMGIYKLVYFNNK